MPTARTPDVRIGVSGWRYPPWRGVFYPRGLPQRSELEFISRELNSVELNGSFYSLQRPSSYRHWYEQTPAGFVFAVKGARFITHMKRLRDVRAPLANFFASGVLALRDKLGPVLWQLPPSMPYQPELLAAFFEQLPRSTAAAARLAERHDERLAGDRTLTTAEVDLPVRHALEIRHDSFLDPGFVRLLREHDVSLVTADTAGKWPLMDQPTADFAYVRLHGDQELYVSGYDDRALRSWAGRVRRWTAAGRDVYVYFDNDAKVHAPFDAVNLAAKLGLAPAPVCHPGLPGSPDQTHQTPSEEASRVRTT